MKFRFLFPKLGIILFAASAVLSLSAQKSAVRAPKQEKLLNGLKVLMWNDPSADKVTVKIRIHSGSSFDPQGKEGVMKLLAEDIFPTAESREFFKDDLGGDLDVISNYDYIQINASSKPSEFLTMLDTLAAAVTNPTIDRETTEKLKTVLLAKIAEMEKEPSYVADQAAAERLFGTFPYGRPLSGTPDSVKKIDFADLRFAKDRFFGADNATMTISGNFDPDLGVKAVRRYFGSWLKSDNKVPSTFRQPDDPDTKLLIVNSPSAGEPVIRFALRGVSRSDKDYAASAVLGRILRYRLQNVGPTATVSNEARILPGIMLIGFRNASATTLPSGLFTEKVTAPEFSKAQAEIAREMATRPADEFWLDADTYKTSASDDSQAFQNVTITDVQRVADRFSKNPIVSVSVQSATSENVK